MAFRRAAAAFSPAMDSRSASCACASRTKLHTSATKAQRTTGLRDHGTTGPQDHRTTGPRDCPGAATPNILQHRGMLQRLASADALRPGRHRAEAALPPPLRFDATFWRAAKAER